jgi:hypothetical protein
MKRTSKGSRKALVVIAALVTLVFLASVTLRVASRHPRMIRGAWAYDQLASLSQRLGWKRLAQWSSNHYIESFDRALGKALQSGRARRISCVLPPGGYTNLSTQAMARGVYILS